MVRERRSHLESFYGTTIPDIDTNPPFATFAIAPDELFEFDIFLFPNPFVVTLFLEHSIASIPNAIDNAFIQLDLPSGLSADTMRYELGTINPGQNFTFLIPIEAEHIFEIPGQPNNPNIYSYKLLVGGDGQPTKEINFTIEVPLLKQFSSEVKSWKSYN